jgi:type IV pilus assembly protein PilC
MDQDITLFTRQFATMMKSGVPLVETIESVAGAVGNYEYWAATMKIQADVLTGSNLVVARKTVDILPNMEMVCGRFSRPHAVQGH